MDPCLVMVEGPTDRRGERYELATDEPAEWHDAVLAGTRVIGQLAHRAARTGFYFNTLVALAFEVARRTTTSCARRWVYHYAHHTTGGRYELAHDG